MTELLPCPHCGRQAGFTNHDDNWHQVICGACGCRSNEFPGGAEEARPKAAASWNTRPALAARQDGVDFVRLPVEFIRNCGCPSDTRMRVGECTDTGTCGCSLMLISRLEQGTPTQTKGTQNG